jgi:hypothetical protein
MPVGIYKHKPNQGFQKGHKIGVGNKNTTGFIFSDISKKKISDRLKGKKKSETHKENIRKAKIGSKNPMYKVGQNKCLNCNKQLNGYQAKRCKSCANKGKNNPQYCKGKPVCIDCNKLLSNYGSKRCNSCRRMFEVGENSPHWIDGLSRNGYPKEFNPTLKLKIRTRDNFTCCLCGKTEREELEELNQVLCVNHIDFDKNNCSEKNLNALCLRCNVKINRERDYWTNYFNKNG